MNRAQERLRKEEEALEAKLFGTPSKGEATPKEATTEDTKTAVAPDTEKPASSTDVKPTAEGDPRTGDEDWKKRYTNLRASRDEKLYETQKALADAREQISELQQRVQELQSAKPVETKDIFAGIISDEDRESIGDVAFEAMRKTAAAAAEENRKALDKELAEIRKMREAAAKAEAERAKKDAYDSFLSRLSRAVPDYVAIDTDPEFAKYMAELDIDGSTRADNFHKAESRGDVATVARFMLDFAANKRPKVSRLEDKITPEAKATSTPRTTGPENETELTWNQVNAHYEKFAKGGYRGRMSEYHAMEKRIDEAAQRGKIVKR